MTPEGQMYGPNSKFWQFWGLYWMYSHISVKFGMVERSGPPCQSLRLSGQRVAPAGDKPIFGPLSKNNTGMPALRSGLPVIILRRFWIDVCYPLICFILQIYFRTYNTAVHKHDTKCIITEITWRNILYYNGTSRWQLRRSRGVVACVCNFVYNVCI